MVWTAGLTLLGLIQALFGAVGWNTANVIFSLSTPASRGHCRDDTSQCGPVEGPNYIVVVVDQLDREMNVASCRGFWGRPQWGFGPLVTVSGVAVSLVSFFGAHF